MIDKRIGKRIKERREELGLTQEDLAEKLGLILLNGLETSADAIFCDVLAHSAPAKASILSEQISDLPSVEQQRILDMVELMVKQAKGK